ncbi:hypothetical protein EDC96DRAFT_439918 [Choanephora cucurbitarum]|nr:hypothetical protein EDC96DRAFT_439918 [Choanephora cucurbitarum]
MVRHDLGLHIREIHLKNRVGITQQEFELLQRHCPYLEILKFNDWRHYKRPIFQSFQYLQQIPKVYDRFKGLQVLLDRGSSLTHLELSPRVVRDLILERLLLPFLTLGNHLTHLTLDGYYSPNSHAGQLQFDYMGWQLLHQSCPHLTHIQMLTVNLKASLDQAKQMATKDHVHGSMTSLVLREVCMDNPIWLVYLAAQYPNLTTLELRFDLDAFTNYDESEEKLSRAGCSAGFLGLANRLTRLHTLSLQCLKGSHFPGELFFDALAHRGVRLQNLTVRYNTDILSRFGLNKSILKAIVRGQQRTVNSLHMDMWMNAHEHFFELLEQLSYCLRLTCLSLASDDFGKFNYNPIPLDTILSACPHLQKLELIRTALVIEDKHTSRQIHPLKSLRIAISRVSESLFVYLTNRCPSISHLEVVTSYWMPREIEMRIDMPNNTFDYVRISDLNKLNVPGLEGNLCFGTSVNLFAVKQLNLLEKHQMRYSKRDDIDVPEDLTSWYHLYEIEDERRLRYPPCCLRKLHRQEVDSLKYLVGFYKTNYYREQAGTTGFIVDRYVSKKNWRDDVRFGFVSLTCKSVRTLKYNYNTIDWPNQD